MVKSLYNHALEKGASLQLNKCESPLLKDVVYHVWNYPSISGEEYLFTFRFVVITFPWKRVWSFISTNVNSIHSWMICTKFAWHWPCGSREVENDKCLQIDKRKDNHTDWRQKTGDHKNSRDISVKIEQKICFISNWR